MKNWLIRKLGGIVIDDFSPTEQAKILQVISNSSLDRQLANMLLAAQGKPIYGVLETSTSSEGDEYDFRPL